MHEKIGFEMTNPLKDMGSSYWWKEKEESLEMGWSGFEESD